MKGEISRCFLEGHELGLGHHHPLSFRSAGFWYGYDVQLCYICAPSLRISIARFVTRLAKQKLQPLVIDLGLGDFLFEPPPWIKDSALVAWKPVDDAYLDSLYARELDKDIKAWPFVWIGNLHSATRRPFLS